MVSGSVFLRDLELGICMPTVTEYSKKVINEGILGMEAFSSRIGFEKP